MTSMIAGLLLPLSLFILVVKTAFALGPVGACGDEGIETAIGCISTNFSSGGFLQTILGVSVGLGGGIALLLMLYGTFIVMTSAGIPDKLNQGKEIITSAAIGLVFIILSIVLMNLIGVSILGLPGL